MWIPVAGYSYYLGSRFYIPSLYRFMNADVYEDTGTGIVGTNMFAYCDNNSVMYVDSDGYAAKSDKSANPIVAFMLSICIGAIIEKSEIEPDDGRRRGNNNITNSTKYILTISFEQMEDAWKYGYRYSKNFSEDIAKVLLCRFKEEIGRPFLFTETCVAKEIDMHFRGYMWAYDGSYNCPIIFSAWCFKNLNFNQNKRKNAILSACKEVDIYEADVYLNKEEALGFNYYNGINKAYINTNSDPYFNGTKRKKVHTERSGLPLTSSKKNKRNLFIISFTALLIVLCVFILLYSNIIDYVSGDFCATETDYLSTISYNGDSYLLMSDTTVWFDYDRQSECCYLGRMKGESTGRRNVKNLVYGFNGDPERNFLYITDAGWPQEERLYIKADIGYPVLNAETVSKICYFVLIDGSLKKEITDKNEIASLLTEYNELESKDIRIVAYLKDYPVKVIIGYSSAS